MRVKATVIFVKGARHQVDPEDIHMTLCGRAIDEDACIQLGTRKVSCGFCKEEVRKGVMI